MSNRLPFIRPLAPSAAVRPPKGDGWLHEPKWDGFRFQVIKTGGEIRFYSRHGTNWTDRLPDMRRALAELPTDSAILDGELILAEARGGAHFWRRMREMRTSQPDESQLVFLAFDLLHRDGVNLRSLPLTERKRDLDRLCRRSKIPIMKLVETFPDGVVLLEHCNRFGFEGVVSKRRASTCASGPSRSWVKVKCPNWKRIHAERWRAFDREDPVSARAEIAASTKSNCKRNAPSLPACSSVSMILTCVPALPANFAGTSRSLSVRSPSLNSSANAYPGDFEDLSVLLRDCDATINVYV